MTIPRIRLADGHSIPQLGLGVYKVPYSDAAALVDGAIRSGYRHIDTATLYGNERGVGEGMQRSGVARDELFVTTKLWNDDHGFDATLAAFDSSIDRLGLDYVDAYLIHWPVPSRDRYVDSWRAIARIRDDGRARSIGVSNFSPMHIERLIVETGFTPVINQIELHPWLPQHATVAFDAAHGIATESWSPLARGRILGDPVLATIAAKHGRSPAQIVIRWHVQRELVVIPKSTSLDRVRSNADVFDFELDAADLAAIATIETGTRTGLDPDLQ
jgi:2,5-diketo-D-gluconate reductase A